MPVVAQNFNARAPSAQDAALAVSTIPLLPVNDAAALQRAAVAAGMVQQGDVYVSPTDGSWIGLDMNGVPQRGVAGDMFIGMPPAPPPGAASQTPAQPGTPTLPPLNLANYTLTPPSIVHGAAHVVNIPRINADPASLQQAATQAGFTADPNHADCYLHPQDQSWIALVNGRIERGWSNIHFRGFPPDLRQVGLATPGSVPATVQASQVQESNYNPASPQAFIAQLNQLGFSAQGPNFYSSGDGSWVALLPDQSVVKGYGQMRVDATSYYQLASPSTNPSQVSSMKVCATPGGLAHDWYEWMRQGVRVAWIPFSNGNFTYAEIVAVLQCLGFSSQNPTANPATWTHPDSSSVTVYSTGQLTNSQFNGWGFGNFPYQNGVHGTMWSSDLTNRWQQWVRNPASPMPCEDPQFRNTYGLGSHV